MNTSANKPLHPTRTWVANRIVFVELDDGRVFGLPAQRHADLVMMTDEELALAAVAPHEYGDSIVWRSSAETIAGISVWDFIEGAPRAVRAWVEGRTVLFEVADGRVFGFPAAGFDRLAKASASDLAAVEIAADGYGLRWEPVDEDISVPGIVAASHGS